MSTPGDASAAKFKANEAWRSHPLLRPTLRQAFPGLALGFGAFVVFTVVEKGFNMVSWKKGEKNDSHGAAHGHAAKH